MTKKMKSTESSEIIRFIKIIVILVIAIIGIYYFSKIFVSDTPLEEQASTEENLPVEINYEKIILGTMFDKADSKYYVLAYDSTNSSAEYYGSLVTSYTTLEDSIPIYTSDLSSVFNQEFYSEKISNPNAKTLEELQVKDGTLFLIENKKITKYIEDRENISKELNE